MIEDPGAHARAYLLLPRHPLARAGLVLLGFALFVLAFFFVAVALIVGAVIASIALVRWWWRSRKLASARSDGALEGEFIVVERSERAPLGHPPER